MSDLAERAANIAKKLPNPSWEQADLAYLLSVAERVTELERERDETDHHLTHCRGLLDELDKRFDEKIETVGKLVMRAEQLETALRRIEAIPAGSDDEGIYARGIALVALDGGTATEPEHPDPSSFGGHPYTPREIQLGYGTDNDPRFADGGTATPLFDSRDERIKELEETLGAILDDYDRRMATKHGRFQVWLARVTSPRKK